MRVSVNDSVEASVIDERIQQFRFVAVKQRNHEAFGVDFGESAADGAVGGFVEPFLKKFVVSVVVAENADEFAV